MERQSAQGGGRGCSTWRRWRLASCSEAPVGTGDQSSAKLGMVHDGSSDRSVEHDQRRFAEAQVGLILNLRLERCGSSSTTPES